MKMLRRLKIGRGTGYLRLTWKIAIAIVYSVWRVPNFIPCSDSYHLTTKSALHCT